MDRIKVMTAMYTLRKGGAYDRFKMMIESFLERGCEVHCLSITRIDFDHPLYRNHLFPIPIRWMNLHAMRVLTVCGLPLYSIWIGWREKIDLFLAFGSLYAFVESFAKRILKKRMVTFIRGDSTFTLRTEDLSPCLVRMNRAIECLGLKHSDRILTVNAADRDRISESVRRRAKGEVFTLYNSIPPLPHCGGEGFPMRATYRIPKDANLLLTAGVIAPGKNIEVLLRSLSKMRSEKVVLAVIGDGLTKKGKEYRRHLSQLVEELDLTHQVVFTGWLEKKELCSAYKAADLFILPSLSEGMPNAMLEALGFDLPCLGSRIPGHTDLLQYDELLFDPSDEAAITHRVRRFFHDSDYSERVKRLCQDRKKEFLFDWKEKMFQMVIEERLP